MIDRPISLPPRLASAFVVRLWGSEVEDLDASLALSCRWPADDEEVRDLRMTAEALKAKIACMELAEAAPARN